MSRQGQDKNNTEIVTAFTRIPYRLISDEVEGSPRETFHEFSRILNHYIMYRKGASFTPEGSGGDYIPSTLRYKKSAGLINKEARFLFGETPDIIVDAKGDVGKVTDESKDALTTQQDLVNTILAKNKFSKNLLQAAKDCFIGKRVACVVNFNEDTGVTVSFLSSLNFVYETDPINTNVITKFVSFVIVRDRNILSERRIYKKKFQMEDGFCYMQEQMFDGRGVLLEDISEYQPTLLSKIPVVVITNDGLIGDMDGESEMDLLEDYESQYSKLANADIDAERKSMNQIKYTVDMTSDSTKGLKSSPGSFWDLQHDGNIENPNPTVGVLDCNMGYSAALTITLDRIKNNMYDQIDVPDVGLDTMKGTITSGKALKAIYWPLIVRCKEKMKTWAPQLEQMVETIIEGSMLYPKTVERYLEGKFITPVAHEIHILNNYPLPEDEDEEKQSDLSEVTAQTMSRRTYMKKWRELTDDECDEELGQIVLETQLLDGTIQMGGGATDTGTGVVDTGAAPGEVLSADTGAADGNV